MKIHTLFLAIIFIFATSSESYSGQLWGWGSNANGQLGNITVSQSNVPGVVNNDNSWASIYAAANNSIGIKADATLWSWGKNEWGQLGLNSLDKSVTPQQVGQFSNWRFIAMGKSHTIGINTLNLMYSWGRSAEGQLGQGNTEQKLAPRAVGTDLDWASAAAGDFHSLAIKTDGSLWGWGDNASGQAGLGEATTNSNSPKRIGSETNWKQVAAGGYHSLAIKTDGSLWGWGGNAFGELGLGEGQDEMIFTPTRVGTDNNWKQVLAKEYHTIALKTDGSLWAWGDNASGQLGDGTTNDRMEPTRVGNTNDWTDFSTGFSHVVAVKSDSTLWAWGANNSGKLGNNTTTRSLSPIKIGDATDWYNCVAGEAHSLGLRKNPVVSVKDYQLAGYSLYPMPATNYFVVESQSGMKAGTVSLLSIAGSSLYNGKIIGGELAHNIDISNLAVGPYMLQILFEDGTKLEKMIIKQ